LRPEESGSRFPPLTQAEWLSTEKQKVVWF
jgi:hypothetical protein